MGRSIPVRHGQTLAHVESVADAAALMTLLCNPPVANASASHACSAMGCDDGVVPAVRRYAPIILDAIVKGTPALKGAATRNLGTALRAAPTRQKLCGIKVRDVELIQLLNWIAAAEDAFRHVTTVMVEESVQALTDTLSAHPVDMPAGHNSCINEPAVATKESDAASAVAPDD